jgi:hypothetical protein
MQWSKIGQARELSASMGTSPLAEIEALLGESKAAAVSDISRPEVLGRTTDRTSGRKRDGSVTGD